MKGRFPLFSLLVLLSCVLAALAFPRSLRADTVLYYADFESADGYDPESDLAGQNGWVQSNTTSGLWNGMTANNFPGQGTQAYIGYYDAGGNNSPYFFLYPTNIAAMPAGKSVAVFTVQMMLLDSSSSRNQDSFFWGFFNADAHNMFNLRFDLSTRSITYGLDDGHGFSPTGQSFNTNVIYSLSVQMDFSNNVWSASLNGNTLVSQQPMTTVGAAMTMGDMDAIWAFKVPSAPGDNFMVFDNYKIAVPGPPTLSTLGLLSNNRLLLELSGTSGSTYVIDATTDLVNWTAIKTNTATDGTFQYLDPNPGVLTRRYYRARLLQ